MENINKTLKYYDLYMLHSLNYIDSFSLPKGYSFTFFKDGDEIEWAKIEMSAGEVLTIEEGLQSFNKSFGNHYELMKERCLFIENDEHEKVATSTAFFMNDQIGKVHWVAVKKEEQGKGLSKPLITQTLKLLKKLGYESTILHTQTHTWLAVKIYLDLGFIPYELEKRLEGWQIIKTLTNHKSLNYINKTYEIYDDKFVSIDKFIQNNYLNYEYKIYNDIFKVKSNNNIDIYSYNYNNQLIITKHEN